MCTRVLQGVYYVSAQHQNQDSRGITIAAWGGYELTHTSPFPRGYPNPDTLELRSQLLGLDGCNWAGRMRVLPWLMKFFLGECTLLLLGF